MKKTAFLLTFVAALFLISCDNETSIIPSDISNVRAEARPGGIFLAWDAPGERNYDHIRTTWFDPLLQTERFWISSVYADTLLIPDTRAKFGEYHFTLQTFSSTGTGGTIQRISAVSGPAPATTVFGIPVQVPLTEEQLSTNAQELSEGPIRHLLTEPLAEFFHTRWSAQGGAVPAPHWFQVDLGREVTPGYFYRFWYRSRNNANNKPTDVDFLGSMDGENWFLLRNFTREADDLNVAAGGQWTSENIIVTEPFRHIRFSVNATNTGSVFFTMSGFRFYTGTVAVIDPEAPN
jgi:hypothetical protein